MNKLLFALILFNSVFLFAQNSKTDSIKIKFNKLKFNEIYELVNSDLNKNYFFTVNDTIQEKNLKDFKCSFIKNYQLSDLTVKPIPKFEIEKNYDWSKNILHYISFNNFFKSDFNYSIYLNNNYLTTEFYYSNRLPHSIIFNCLPTASIGSNLSTMMKLNLQEKYFVFQINDINNVLFIVDEGKVYAITNPNKSGGYLKTEINEFFQKNVVVTKNFNSNSGRNKKSLLKKFNYYFTI